ncbi:polymorphic toxin type 15 domain-containing protein [Agrococcus terreus]|uniref:polymorphic toxin type 15 domain-containing protein n=1 Tax=Agrococcus terreus TaxID=574649 RepID=UPI00384E6B37
MSQALKTLTREAIDALQDVLPRIARGVAGQSKRSKDKIKEMAEAIRRKDAELARGVRRQDVDNPTTMDVDVRAFNNRRYDQAEFNRQVNEQVDALQQMSVADWIRNRGDYLDRGRTSASTQAQRMARDAARKTEIMRLRRLGQDPLEAARNADAWLSTQAATHRLDGIAGGDLTDISGVGDSGVNSSLGSQWRGRVGALDQAVLDFVAGNPGVDLSTVFMNINLT